MEINKKIKSYQAGGYLTYQPLPMMPEMQLQAEGSSIGDPAQAKAKDDDTYLDKSILTKMLGQGITTDVMAYSDELQQAYQEYNSMSDFQRVSYKGKQLRSVLKGDIGQLNALIRGKDTLDTAMQRAATTGALEELAVTSNGMIVKDIRSGKVTQVSFAEYASDNNNKDKKYAALTNAQLGEEREYNKQLIGNSRVFSILNYGKGMEQIKKEIMEIAQGLGSTKTSTSSGSFDKNESNDMQELIAAAKQGSFKVKSGEAIETNSAQLESAKLAMWANLSENSKNVLRARSASMVANPADIEKMSQQLAASLLDPLAKSDVSKIYDETLRAPGSGTNGANEKMTNMNGTEMAFHGIGTSTPLSMVGDYGVKIDGMAYALPPQLYTDSENKRLPLSNAGKLNQVSFLSKAFSADGSKVSPNHTMIIGDAYFAKLPVIKDENGNMQIDQVGAKKWAEYEQALERVPASQRTPMKESELKHKYNVTNMVIERLVVAEAASYDNSYSIFSDRNEDYYKPLDKETEKLLGETVDPEKDGPRNWIDYAAHKHLVFIPAKSEADARFADGNSARVADRVYDVARGFNTQSDNSTIYSSGNDVPAAFSADTFKNK